MVLVLATSACYAPGCCGSVVPSRCHDGGTLDGVGALCALLCADLQLRWKLVSLMVMMVEGSNLAALLTWLIHSGALCALKIAEN